MIHCITLFERLADLDDQSDVVKVLYQKYSNSLFYIKYEYKIAKFS